MSTRNGLFAVVFWLSSGAVGIFLLTFLSCLMKRPAICGYVFYMAFCGAGLVWSIAADFLHYLLEIFSKRFGIRRASLRDCYVASLGVLVFVLYGICAAALTSKSEDMLIKADSCLSVPEAAGKVRSGAVPEQSVRYPGTAGQLTPSTVAEKEMSSNGAVALEKASVNAPKGQLPLESEENAAVPSSETGMSGIHRSATEAKDMLHDGTAGSGRLSISSAKVLQEDIILVVLDLRGKAGGAKMFHPENTDALCFDILGKWSSAKVHDVAFRDGCLSRLRAAYHPDRLRIAGISRKRGNIPSGRIEYIPDQSQIRIYFERHSD